MSSEPLKEIYPDTLDLSGLEDLLGKAHLELIGPADSIANEGEEGADVEEAESESKLILELLSHLVRVNEVLRETNSRLNLTANRLSNLDEVYRAQTLHLELIPEYQRKIGELELALDLAISENNWLKKRWWERFFAHLRQSQQSPQTGTAQD